MARIKLLRNKREIQVKQMRKEISQLLTTGQEPSARIRVCISLSLFSFYYLLSISASFLRAPTWH
jgi:hypothetical protein